MTTQRLKNVFSIKPNPAAAPIRFDATAIDAASADPSFVVFPCDADEPAFMNAAKRGYTVPEILDYYLVQSGFHSLDAAKREIHAFFNDLTGCACNC